MRRYVSLLALILLFTPLPVHAQVTGTISGYVQDQGAGMVPGATVTAELTGQQLVRSTQSNETGFFDLQALPRGTYTVKVEISGFQTQIQRNVEVTNVMMLIGCRDQHDEFADRSRRRVVIDGDRF